MKLFAQARHEKNLLAKYRQTEIHAAQTALWFTEKIRLAFSLNGLALIAALASSALYAWQLQQLTLGDFSQIMMQAFWVLTWMWFLSFQMVGFSREWGALRDNLSVLYQPRVALDRVDARPLQVTYGNILFENVSYAYENKIPVFDNLNFTIKAGEKIGLVGLSGAGKSTLIMLLLRLYDLPAGKIKLDEYDIANVTQDSLRQQIAVIPQDVILFHRTLKENIRYGCEEATDAEIYNAARLAHCQFITDLPNQYETIVGERGVTLSGGQRQRIAIARAFLKNAPIIILDEATSALDSFTEECVQKSLQTLTRGKTTLVIAHRVSTLTNMDRILRIENGKIVDNTAIQKACLEKSVF